MTKFEEYRDRAYEFHKKTECNFEIDSDGMFIGSLFGIRHNGDFIFNDFGLVSITTESEWLASIEQHFGAPFPSLLETQGWVKIDKNTPFVSGHFLFMFADKGIAYGETYQGNQGQIHAWINEQPWYNPTYYRKIEFGGAE